MQRVFRVVETQGLRPVGTRTTTAFNRSVRRLGVVIPVLLADVIDADGVVSHSIIDGNRRIRAAQAARLPKVPAVVLHGTTKEDRARLTLMSNYMRSGNFHTEASAILALADDDAAAARAARTIGLGPVKMQQLYRKISSMPEPVRRALYEHRIPVTAAASVGAWPEGLQRELVELLASRRSVTTAMVKDLREWYAERHPEEFPELRGAVSREVLDAWSETSVHVADIPVPHISLGGVTDARDDQALGPVQANSRDVPASSRPSKSSPDSGPASTRPYERISSAAPVPALANVPYQGQGRGTSQVPSDDLRSEPTASTAHSTIPVAIPAEQGAGLSTREAGTSVAPPPDVDTRAERMVAFVVRLDAGMREFAREGHELGIDRSIWIDRAMRAWDGIAE